jgi:PAS domain S-box-containing protein
LLEAQVNARIHVVNGLAALVRSSQEILPEEFESFAQGLTQGLPGVRSVQLAKDAVVSHVWPIAGNRQALGLDLRAHPTQGEATRRTIEGRRLVVAGPFDLLQGGVGIVARQPIFLGSGDTERFWGMATLVIDLPPLLASSGLLGDRTIAFALRGRDGLGEKGAVFHGDADLFASDPVLFDITLPDGRWQMAARPVGGWTADRPGRNGFWALSVVGILLAILMVQRIAADFFRRRVDQENLRRNLSATQALSDIMRYTLSSKGLREVLEEALVRILKQPWLRLEQRGSVFLLEPNGKFLRLAAEYALPDQLCLKCRDVPLGHCLCGIAAEKMTAVFQGHVTDDHHVAYDGMADHGHYCVPIIGGGGLLGVLNVYVSAGHRRSEDEEQFLLMACSTLAGIIERARSDQRHRESQELSRVLMNASDDAACLLTPEGLILSGNDALAIRFGTDLETLKGQDFFALLPMGLKLERKAQFAEILETGHMRQVEEERKGRILDTRLYPVKDDGGHVIQVAIFSRDVTEQRNAALMVERTRDELARSNEELQQFAYVASHDLRQPLRMVGSYLALIERKLGTDISDDMKSFIGYATGGAKRMDRLILDLLEYSRVGRGHVPKEMVPLDEAVSDALMNLQFAVEESGATVKVVSDLHGDRSELTRLFQNLIGNGVKYRAPERPSRVQISCQSDDSGWLIAVADNGIGIPADGQDRVFGVFQRLVTADAYEGTGIGLAVCRKIVEHHGGRIWVESEPDLGATFLFTLPSA